MLFYILLFYPIKYKITFTQLTNIDSILGLTSISATDAVNKVGTQLKVKLN